MKPATPTIQRHEVPDVDLPIGRLLGMEVELSPNLKTMRVSLEYQGSASAQPDVIHLAMLPPAAAQLSRMLRKAVKAYLRSGDGSEGNDQP